jgi:hypothetical protein
MWGAPFLGRGALDPASRGGRLISFGAGLPPAILCPSLFSSCRAQRSWAPSLCAAAAGLPGSHFPVKRCGIAQSRKLAVGRGAWPPGWAAGGGSCGPVLCAPVPAPLSGELRSHAPLSLRPGPMSPGPGYPGPVRPYSVRPGPRTPVP